MFFFGGVTVDTYLECCAIPVERKLEQGELLVSRAFYSVRLWNIKQTIDESKDTSNVGGQTIETNRAESVAFLTIFDRSF